MRRSWRGSYPRHQRDAAALTQQHSSSSSAFALTRSLPAAYTQVRDLVGRVMANVYLAEGGGGEVKVELSPTPIRPPPPPAEPQNAAAPSTAAVVVVAEAVETGAEAPAAPELAFEPAPFRFSIEVPPDTMLGAATKLGGLYSYAEVRVKLI